MPRSGSYECVYPLNQVVLANQQLLEPFACLGCTALLQAIYLTLNGRSLPFVPSSFENARALIRLMDVRFGFARDGSDELGLHHA